MYRIEPLNIDLLELILYIIKNPFNDNQEYKKFKINYACFKDEDI